MPVSGFGGLAGRWVAAGVERAVDLPEPPAHLSQSASEFWRTTVAGFELQAHHLRLLQLACEAWDRCEQAREVLSREGLTARGERGAVKAHPAVGVERDSRLAVARLLRELDLDAEPPTPDRSGPPAIFSNRGLRHHAREKENAEGHSSDHH
jgi:P27 family predicted phage terminase small subunit